MSFLEELKKELHTVSEEKAWLAANRYQNEMAQFVAEELSHIRKEISRKEKNKPPSASSGGRQVYEGVRLWHEGEYRNQTDSLANFYAFLSQDMIMVKEILSRHKRLLFGFHYEIRYRLSDKGQLYYRLFTENMLREGVTVDPLFVRCKNKDIPLPYVTCGNVKYDFEMEHHINSYPKLYYTYRIEI